jgi:hypothetical protein
MVHSIISRDEILFYGPCLEKGWEPLVYCDTGNVYSGVCLIGNLILFRKIQGTIQLYDSKQLRNEWDPAFEFYSWKFCLQKKSVYILWSRNWTNIPNVCFLPKRVAKHCTRASINNSIVSNHNQALVFSSLFILLGSISPNIFTKQNYAGAQYLVKKLPFNFTNDSMTKTVNYIFGKAFMRHSPNVICQKGIKFCKQKSCERKCWWNRP